MANRMIKTGSANAKDANMAAPSRTPVTMRTPHRNTISAPKKESSVAQELIIIDKIELGN